MELLTPPTGDTRQDIQNLYEALFRLWELEEYRWALTQKDVKSHE